MDTAIINPKIIPDHSSPAISEQPLTKQLTEYKAIAHHKKAYIEIKPKIKLTEILIPMKIFFIDCSQ